MRSISDITTELTAAETLVRNLREERSSTLLQLCGRKPGDIFEQGGQRYRVRTLSAASRGTEVWLNCDYWTSAKKWSQGTKIVNMKVEG